MTLSSYTVTHLDSATDITTDIEEVEINDTGTDEITSAKIILNARSGKFITSASIIDEFHKIRIQVTDDAGLTYDRVYEVSTLRPLESSAEGHRLEVELLGLEQHTQNIHFARQFYFASAFDVVKELIDIYNVAKGSLQPTIEKHDDITFNELPKWTANTFEFNIGEKFVYDGINEVIDRLGSSVAAGGAADFFELYFAKHPTDNNKLQLKVFSSGSKPASPVTISETLAINPSPQEGGIEPTSGTVLLAWGADDFGTLPPDFSKFHGELEAFSRHPQWADLVPWPIGSRVQWLGTHYERFNSAVSPPYPATPPNFDSNWHVITEGTVLGSSKYSPWTDGKAAEWKNSGSNPNGSGADFDQKGCWDSNLVIFDGDHSRIDVVQRVASPTGINTQYLYGAISTGIYRGLRVLVDPQVGALSGVFAGSDINGVPFSGNVAQYDGVNWAVVLLHPEKNPKVASQNGDQVAVTEQGKVYEKGSGQWADVTTLFDHANDCFHIYTSLTNTAGINSTLKSGGGTYGDTSAIQVQYDYTPFSVVTFGLPKTAGFFKIGAWLNFRLPFPHNTYNGVATLGALYGNNTTKKEPVTIDSNNMHFTHSGNVGFNNSEVEDLGPLSALQLFVRFKWTDGTGARLLEGNFKMRCTIYDTSGNIVVQDFTIAFNDVMEQILLPLANFKLYRARVPLRWGNIIPNIFPNQLDVLNVFEWKNIKQICIQWQEVYDDLGRYSPEGSRAVISPLLTGSARIILTLDGWAFVKPLLTTSGQNTSRNLEPNFMQMQQISNYVQLKQAALSQVEIEKFRHKQFDIQTELKLNIAFGDSFFLTHPILVNEADSGANTIKLVNKHTKYTITKPASGPGQGLRFITGVKRFTS